MARFEVKRITAKEMTPELSLWLVNKAYELNARYDFKYSGWVAQDWMKYFANPNHVFLFCFENGAPRGFIWGHLGASIFDSSKIIFKQVLFFNLPNSRASKLLLDSFIDFGRQNANLVMSTIGTHSNISAKSLRQKGFKLLEVDFLLEV